MIDGDTGGSTPEENAARLRDSFALLDASQDGAVSLEVAIREGLAAFFY